VIKQGEKMEPTTTTKNLPAETKTTKNLPAEKKTTLPEAGKKPRTVFDSLMLLKPQLQAALPSHITPDRMLRIAVTALRRNPKLQQTNQLSLFGAILTCAQLGLEPNDPRGLAYLIPYGQECQLIIGYRGYIELAIRSGMVASIRAYPVYSKDTFTFEYGLQENLTHIPYTGQVDPGNVLCSYAVATLKNGTSMFVVVSKGDIERARNVSSSGKRNEGPWKDWYPEMAAKTAIRKIAKWLPQSPEWAHALEADESKAIMNPETFEVEITPDIDFPMEAQSDQKPNGKISLSDSLSDKAASLKSAEAEPLNTGIKTKTFKEV
jgi:recombination protein RecT